MKDIKYKKNKSKDLTKRNKRTEKVKDICYY